MDNSKVDLVVEMVRAQLATLDNVERAAVLLQIVEPPDVRSAVEYMLKSTGGNVSHAARALGVSRRTVQVRMKALGLPPGKAGRRSKLA
jgi:transcriptional regulator of acetoin/glycerol metabolism